MLFNSYIFLLAFLPLVLWGWWRLPLSAQARLALLAIASYLFYGWWDARFVSLLALSTLIDYAAGHRIAASQSRTERTGWLAFSLATNLGLLAIFKYCGFMAETVNALCNWAHAGTPLTVPQIILPAGISFYTFQTMSYSIDIYRGHARPAPSLLHFATYVSLFPQLIAGPIVRYTELEDTLQSDSRHVDWNQCARGIHFFVAGMCQKVLLADTMAARIDPLLQRYSELDLVSAWFCLLGYACQLYFDFAGYSNMAVGLGHLLGFQFPQNFNSPYKSASIAEFWRRWHMSLSFWLRDYLFIPLGGNRHGARTTVRNLFIVMALGGLWHGAGWTFVIWGLYHGILLATHALWKERAGVRLPPVAAQAVTFLAVLVGWAIFRSHDLEMCGSWLAAMAGMSGLDPQPLAACGGVGSFSLLAFLLAIVFALPNTSQLRLAPRPALACLTALALLVCVLRFNVESPFLYFQF
jgi:alginate O-acetyltransferase complex protein AlgI